MKKKLITDYCKKGQDLNLMFVVVMTLVIAFVIVAGFRAVKELNKATQNMPLATQEQKDIMQNVQDKYVGIWDVLFLIFFILISLILIAAAFFIDTHPVFFIITFVMTVITGFVGGHLANAYSSFSETPGVSAEAVSFTIIPYIFQHFVIIIIIIGTLTTIALFAKIKSSSG